MRIFKTLAQLLLFVALNIGLMAQENTNKNIFRQLTEELPSPNSYRTASGRPGPDYFQQKVDYIIKVKLDEEKNSISGEEIITYNNNSKETLNYLWLQLDQNILEPESFSDKISVSSMNENEPVSRLVQLNDSFSGGFNIISVTDDKGRELQKIINHTIMKVVPEKPISPGEKYSFRIKWHYNINNLKKNWARSGIDPLGEDGDNIYAIAQFYPRLCVFNDYGWQIKQFVGAEFALEFGDFEVSITVPSDHIVGATGELQNKKTVLGPEAVKRLSLAIDSDSPVFIITPEEAKENEDSRSDTYNTWIFKAENVRDFAFASSRKFIWDAMGVTIGKNRVLAMSFYPNESFSLWSKFSTKTIAHTLRVYSKYTFDYPYPTAQSVDCSLGMEYPMIAFNGGRPFPDGSYSKATRNSMIGVIRHEVGHNFIPMIVNTDERQWSWMDEGFNIFLQGLGERKWDINQYWSGIPTEMIGYMDDDKSTIVPVMTHGDGLLQAGMNSYRKPAVGLTILRETILGRELFDQAFKEYTNTWKFKHPQPCDFFRIMEDASGVDLDWFWRGWYFTTDYVDLSIDKVKLFIPVYDEETAREAAEYEAKQKREHIATIRDREFIENEIDIDSSLRDKYNSTGYQQDIKRKEMILSLQKSLSAEEKSVLEEDKLYYEITFKSYGGMIMPLILRFDYVDNSSEVVRIPAEIWMKNQEMVTKVFVLDKEVKSIVLDPYIETADVNTSNNFWPRRTEKVYMQIR